MCVVQEYEEYLLSEGLITDDMSERIVTSLPKCLSDSTMRGSRESLRSSHDSVPASSDSLQCTHAAGPLATAGPLSAAGPLATASSCDDVMSATRLTSDRLTNDTDHRRRGSAGQWKLLEQAVYKWIDHKLASTGHRQQRHTLRSVCLPHLHASVSVF